MKSPIRVAVTDAAGQIGYSLLFRIASGDMFGADQSVILHLIEIEPALPALQGVVMELQDCAFPLLKGTVATASLEEGFKDVNWALLLGSVPLKGGLVRRDLLATHGKIYTSQGKAIAVHAAKDVRILVAGDPCNTNCLVAMNNAKSIPSDRWFAMTMLDQNRAATQLAIKAGVETTAVTNLAVFGHHSSTMYPDFTNASINGQMATTVITDFPWFKHTFLPKVRWRGIEISKARGLSSVPAASAANAVVDTIRNLTTPTPAGTCFSVGVCSDGSYGIEKGLIFSYPMRSDGQKLTIVQGVEIGEFSRVRLTVTELELKEEKHLVRDLLPNAYTET